jgi:hypothetical protein
MDIYRIAVVRDGVRRVMDADATEVSILVREATQNGWTVSCVLLPRGVELIRGVMEEPSDISYNS